MLIEAQSHRDTEKWTIPWLESLTSDIIKYAIEVHKECGPGLLEKVYRDCLAHELTQAGYQVAKEVAFQYQYKQSDVKFDFKIDMLVQNSVVLELKSVMKVIPVYEAHLHTYLKLSGYPCGLILNFYVPVLTQGIVRKMNYDVLSK